MLKKELKKFVIWLKETSERITRGLFLFLIYFYKAIGSVHLGGSCRFNPSCSDYALEAIKKHHPNKALKLIFLRLLRCRPGGDFGDDPVPEIQKN